MRQKAIHTKEAQKELLLRGLGIRINKIPTVLNEKIASMSTRKAGLTKRTG